MPLRAEQPVRARHTAAARNILLVEDDDSNSAYALEALKLLNCHVRLACTGRDAVDSAREGRFDLILMDYRLPDINGLQAVHLIRLREAGSAAPRVPVVMVTASVMCTEVDRYFSAGVNDVLVKPFSLSQLSGVVDRWCAANTTLGNGGAIADLARALGNMTAAEMNALLVPERLTQPARPTA